MDESKYKILTINIIRKGDEILLAMKKRGFGAGKWNGYGGKAKDGEKPEQAAKREILEESGLVAEELDLRGLIYFDIQGKADWQKVYIYEVLKYSGTPAETEEMKPQWFKIKDVPYEQMFAGDQKWLPEFLAGKQFKGHFVYDQDFNLLEDNLAEIDRGWLMESKNLVGNEKFK